MERGQATRPRRGDELELQIDRLAYGGAGVARANGYVVFVRDAVPGDRVRARVTRSRRSFAEADSVELLEPSPVRVEPVAPHPGAPWQVLPYGRQLGEKEAQVRDALERLGGFESPPVEPILPADRRLGYRNKVEYSFGADEDGELVLGFHRRGRVGGIDGGSRDIPAPAPVHGRRTGRLQARLVTSPRATFRASELAAATPADSVLWTRAASVAETTREGETERVKGPLALEEKLSGLTFRISPDAFFQTNTEMAERLYGTAGELAGLSGRERVLDLFCGIGTIALVLALDAGEVFGVELVEQAVADAIENARVNGVDNARFFAGDVRLAMRPLLERSGKPDVVVVDPPRAGLSQKVVRRVLEAEAKRIVYVSCNSTTFAPNARQMVDAGSRLRTVRPGGMFPQTPHIECVALLERAG